MEPQVITFHHFSFFFFQYFSVASLLSCGNFSFRKLSGCEFLCLRMLSEAITELYFSFYLSLFFFCPKEKFGQII